MENIFSLTKGEQRIVIGIVVALLVGAIAKHYYDARSSTGSSLRSTIQPTASPFASPPEDEGETPDESP